MEPRPYGPFPYTPINQRPRVAWPGGAYVALWVIPNVEFFPLDEAVPRGSAKVPDIPGVKIGGWNGFFAIKPPILIFASLVSSDVDEVAHWDATVPNDPRLIGWRIAVQGLSDAPGQTPTWTNTATLEFKQ